jgi:hypothetical protein
LPWINCKTAVSYCMGAEEYRRGVMASERPPPEEHDRLLL